MILYKNSYSFFINLTMTIFFVGLIVIPKAYGMGIVLSVLGLFYFLVVYFKNKVNVFNRNYLGFYIIFFIYFFVYLLGMFIYSESSKTLDSPSRALYFLLIFFLLQFLRDKLKLLLYIIPLGAIAAGLVASYQVFILQQQRALSFSFQMPIQHGDMAMSLGMFSLAILFYCLKKNMGQLSLLNFFGVLGGAMASLLSLSRGGWLLMPLIILTMFYINNKYFSKRSVVAILLSLFIFGGTFLVNKTAIIHRLEVAYNQVSYSLNNKEDVKRDGSIAPRLALWNAAWIAIKEKPILGWGDKGAKLKRQQQFEEGVLNYHDSQYGHAHNQYINDFLERGVIGLASLLLIFLFPLWKFYKAYKENKSNIDIQLLAILGIIHITSVMSYCLTQDFLDHNSGNMFYFFLIVLFYAMILSFQSDKNR